MGKRSKLWNPFHPFNHDLWVHRLAHQEQKNQFLNKGNQWKIFRIWKNLLLHQQKPNQLHEKNLKTPRLNRLLRPSLLKYQKNRHKHNKRTQNPAQTKQFHPIPLIIIPPPNPQSLIIKLNPLNINQPITRHLPRTNLPNKTLLPNQPHVQSDHRPITPQSHHEIPINQKPKWSIFFNSLQF